MHVHVTHPDGEAKFWLEPAIELAVNQGLSERQLSAVLETVRSHHKEIVDAWHKHFGH